MALEASAALKQARAAGGKVSRGKYFISGPGRRLQLLAGRGRPTQYYR
jgi:hypothetical protein